MGVINETELRRLVPSLRSFSKLEEIVFPAVPYVSNADLMRLQEEFPDCRIARLGYVDPPRLRYIENLQDEDPKYRYVDRPSPATHR